MSFTENYYSFLEQEESHSCTLSEDDEDSDDVVFDDTVPKPTPKKQVVEVNRVKCGRRRVRNQLASQLKNEWQKSSAHFTPTLINILQSIQKIIQEFLLNESSQMLALPPMPSQMRKIYMYMADYDYFLTYKVRGHHTTRCLVLYKTSRTRMPSANVQDEIFERALKESVGVDLTKIRHQQMAIISDGDVVGELAKPLDDTNVGYRMLKQMGYTPDSEQTDCSITVRVKKGREGLGNK